ncbi:amylo-alpha-1,6-glucosidase [Actinacidiphila acidipaludis]|uniref:amylo-alpha-1,6-glucosidase n=1 Tax=Actinacidiphila acidipaludis TaxID=2873382 RepID=UPI0027DF5F29|nr:glycogen debranching N-terminal domain-containing protein [Streptomyces acidipaludis]
MEATVKAHGDFAGGQSVPGLQPFLHDAHLSLAAPSLCASGPDGALRGGADGFYHGDRRVLSRLEAAVEAVPVVPIGAATGPEGDVVFRAVLRGLAEQTPDPAVVLERSRAVSPGRLTERYTVRNAGGRTARLRLSLSAASDLATMEQVKSGRPAAPVSPRTGPGEARWSDGAISGTLTLNPGPDEQLTGPDGTVTMAYLIEVPPGTTWHAELRCDAEHRDGDLFPAPPKATRWWSAPEVTGPDRRLAHWISRSDRDLFRLVLSDPLQPEDVFLAAGAPWYLTLFGRDALWSARMLLPLGTDVAAGTLRTLARRQGTAHVPATEEQPGKILHEVRRDEPAPDGTTSLPPSYYGTADATPLWLILLYDAWRWGMPESEVAALLPHAEAALNWMEHCADADGDGFLEYADSSGAGLSNQGWKDSSDGIRFRDGRPALAPIALSEVQAYAHEAAVKAAALLDAFARPGGEQWRRWAEGLRERFRTHFWTEDDTGPYPAVALDRDKRRVDSVASNMGHLLGTGLLGPEESARVAGRLTDAGDTADGGMDSGFGLRTLDASSAGFNALGYHTGSVWPHDTAIAVHGLARAGRAEAAGRLATGLLGAAEQFGYRLPELFAGYSRDRQSRPAPYPASCRPQAWAAASSVLVLQSLFGLEADVPARRLRHATRVPSGFEGLRVRHLRIGGRHFDVSADAEGRVEVHGLAGFTLVPVHATGW